MKTQPRFSENFKTVAVVLLLVLAGGLLIETPKWIHPRLKEREVIAVAEKAVLDALDSPRTTKFVSESRRYEADTIGYLVGLAVDTQNVFGAMLRKHYVVRVIRREGGLKVSGVRELPGRPLSGNLQEVAKQNQLE